MKFLLGGGGGNSQKLPGSRRSVSVTSWNICRSFLNPFLFVTAHYRRGGGRGRGRFNRGRDRGRFGKGNRGDRDGEKDDTDKKEAPQGQHVHFDDDSSDGGKMEEDEKKPVKRPADENDDEGEPSVKQVKIDSKTDDENKTTQPPEEKADS